MKKIKIMLIILFLLSLFSLQVVSAKVFECKYKQEDTNISSHWFTISVDTDNKTVSLLDHDGKNNSVLGSSEYNIESIKNNWFLQQNNDTCLSTTFCYNGRDGGTPTIPKTNYKISIFFTMEEAKNTIGVDKIVDDHFDAIGTDKYRCVGYVKQDTKCDKYLNTKQLLIEEYNKYKECGENNNCKISSESNINKIKKNIKTYCKQILESANYNDECTVDCINIESLLEELEKNSGIDTTSSSDSACGFSKRLITWIINIIRWLKYILPIFVIVLGILDFIKAISSDKEDELKKAQKRFIIRLIAAALIFLIPLIIEFVLTKMGFNYNDCGLY